MSDEALVYVKRAKTDDNGCKIATMLQFKLSLEDNPHDYCVPVPDMFQDTDDSKLSYMVMLFLHLIDPSPFDSIRVFMISNISSTM